MDLETKLVLNAPLIRSFSRRFIAGTTREEAFEVTKKLNSQGIGVTLDYLGESVTTKEKAKHAVEEYKKVLEIIDTEKLSANIAVKCTKLVWIFLQKEKRFVLIMLLNYASMLSRLIILYGSTWKAQRTLTEHYVLFTQCKMQVILILALQFKLALEEAKTI